MANPTDYQLGPNNTSIYIPSLGKWLVPSDGAGTENFGMPDGSGEYRATSDWNKGTPWRNTELLDLPFFGKIAGGQLYDQMPGSKRYEFAPDEGFMASFKNVAPFILGGAMPFLFPGAGLAGGSGAIGGVEGSTALGGSATGAIGGGATGALGGSLMPAAVPESVSTLQSWGMQQVAPGVWELPASSVGGPLMPAAQPETVQQLREWGMREVAPGRWELPPMPEIPNLPNTRAPVEDRTRVYDPTSQTFTPNLGNVASGLAKIGGLPGTGGASGMDPRLKNIKDALSISSAVGSLLSGLNLPSQGDLAGLSRATDAGRRAVVNSNLKQIEDSFGQFNDDYFNRIADAFKNYYQPQVKDTFDLATKKTIYAAPGGVGSTAFADQLGRVEKDRQLADTAVGEQSADEAARAKAAIEGTKSNLIGLASSSEDPGAFGAQAAAAAKASAQTPTYNPLADLFSRYANLAANAAVAGKQGYGSTGTTPTSFGGYGGAGSKGSVSTVWR